MKKLILTGIWLLCGFLLPAQELEQNVEERLQTFFREYTTHTATSVPASWIVYALTSGRRNCLSIQTSALPTSLYRPETVDAIYRHLGQILPGPVNYFDLTVFTDGKSIEELIPNLYRKGKKDKARLFSHLEYKGTPWVTRTSRPYDITRGLEGRHIACGKATGNIISMTRTNGDGNVRGCSAPQKTNSHNRSSCLTSCRCWKMQEPMYSLPRERDRQKQEIIVDNDDNLNGHRGQTSLYLEVKSRKAQWETNLPSLDFPTEAYLSRQEKILFMTVQPALPN